MFCLRFTVAILAIGSLVAMTRAQVPTTPEGVKTQPVPVTVEMLFPEMKEANAQINTQQTILDKIQPRQTGLEEQRKKGEQLFSELIQAMKQCGTPKGSAAVSNAATNLSRNVRWTGSLLEAGREFRLMDGPEICKKLKSEPGFMSELQAAFENGINDQKNAIATDQENANKLRTAWQERLTALENRQKELQASEQKKSPISSNLPWIVLTLCFFCCVILFGIRFFSSQVQMELVASGQLIQFPTVMVLLVVIIALALSDILKGDSLAALLGGIAGYVLSQGVGRAVARQAQLAHVTPAEDSTPTAQNADGESTPSKSLASTAGRS